MKKAIAPVSVILGTIFYFTVMAYVHADENKKIVLQISDGSEEKQALVLSVADNLTRKYGDSATIEVVAFGPGLRMLLNNNLHDAHISELAEKGIRFSACRNTYRKMNKMLGKEQSLHKYATEVEGGANRIIELVGQGYILLHP